MKRYAVFELLVEKVGESYRARVVRSPAGEASVEFAPPFSKEELEVLTPLLSGSGRDVGPRAKAAAQERFRQAGTRLFQSVFTGPVLNCFHLSLARAGARKEGLRLLLRLLQPELTSWPWEYLYDPDRYGWLALVPGLAIVRYLEAPAPRSPLTISRRLRVLVVAAEATGTSRLDAEKEWNQIQRGLRRLGRLWVRLERLERATLADLQEKLAQGPWHVLHFIGHGGLDRSGEGVLRFHDAQEGSYKVSGRDLGTLLLGNPHLRLVVLNACESAREGMDEVFSSVAQALVHRGIPAVLAMRAPVSDPAAVSFARRFYRALARGAPLEEGLTRTRQGLFAEHHEVEWGTPVLYLRTEDGRILIRPWAKIAAALLLLLTLIGWGTYLFLNQRERDVNDTPSQALHRTKSHPRCPMPFGIPMQLITPAGGRAGAGLKPFCIGFFEVTQNQWKQVMKGSNPSWWPGRDRPVEKVTFEQVQDFLARLDPWRHFRLPTDAEWSYAAPRGTLSSSVLPDNANCSLKGDEIKHTAPVGQFRSKEFGLYDMLGNVWEWVADGAQPGKALRRGGGWNSFTPDCQSSSREEKKKEYKGNDTGFRIVCDPLP